jgi:hypothetical protein
MLEKNADYGSAGIMTRRSFGFVASLALATGLVCFAPCAYAADGHRKVHVNLADTGQTVVVPVGEDLVVSVPMRPYDDNYWYVARNSGDGLKLIAGPNERRGPRWTPFKTSVQVFYFRKEAPGTAHLVLEQSYGSKPMILKVVDR